MQLPFSREHCSGLFGFILFTVTCLLFSADPAIPLLHGTTCSPHINDRVQKHPGRFWCAVLATHTFQTGISASHSIRKLPFLPAPSHHPGSKCSSTRRPKADNSVLSLQVSVLFPSPVFLSLSCCLFRGSARCTHSLEPYKREAVSQTEEPYPPASWTWFTGILPSRIPKMQRELVLFSLR